MQIGELIDDLLNETLLGTYRAHFNELKNAIGATDVSITTLFPIQGIGDGSYLEMGQELMYVVPGGVNVTAQTLAVLRGVRGTTPIAHGPNAGISINPRFARSVILSAMQEEVRSWPISIFRAVQIDTTVGAYATNIDLAAAVGANDILRTIKVWRRGDQPDQNRWIPITGWRFERDLFSMGSADLYLAKTYSSGQEFRILVARPFPDPVNWTETTDLTAVFIPQSCADIIKYGSAWRLVTGREVRRNFTEIESEGRNAQEVPPGANLTLGRNLKLMRDGRLAEEITRLRSLYGVRSR